MSQRPAAMSADQMSPAVAMLAGGCIALASVAFALYWAGGIHAAKAPSQRKDITSRGRSRSRAVGARDADREPGRKASPCARMDPDCPQTPQFYSTGTINGHTPPSEEALEGRPTAWQKPVQLTDGGSASDAPAGNKSLTQLGVLGHNGTIPPITIPPPAVATHTNGRLQQQLSPRSTTPRSMSGARGSASPNTLAKHNAAFHVTTRLPKDSGREVNKRPPPHMLLQTVQGPMQASGALNGLITVPQLADPKDRGRAIEEEAVGCEYNKVITSENTMTTEEEAVCHQLVQALDLRWKWLFRPRVLPEHDKSDHQAVKPSDLADPFAYNPLPPSAQPFRMRDGVFRVYEAEGSEEEAFPVPGTAKEFFTDMLQLCKVGAAGPVKTYCHHRLVLLEQRFNLHVMLNADKEFLAQKTAPHRDFYNVRKVDTHVHHSACMHQKHLLRFIKSKLKKEPDEIVIFRDGKFLTLLEVFESLNLTAYDLNVDTLDMHADKTIFHRFDKFNLKYNPFGQSRLREIFIKQDNLLHGRFLAELTQEVFTDLEDTKYQHTEYRISIYGRKTVEWDVLAAWVCQNKLYSDNNVWLIQIPRLYNVYKAQGLLDSFEQMIENIFLPLFEVTADPTSHPQLHIFLQQVVGFDCVDDESKPERRPTKSMPSPAAWNTKHNAAYSYYTYYLYANLYTLNKFRESRGLNTFTFRPHCGEAGEIDHLASAFMACENVAHGIQLRKSPFLQYLYYLAQIGLCMSPLSNNSLFLDYHRNPFPTYFARGLSVSLSTDDPLQIHLTKEPLVEEYSVAANMWKLTTTDCCEIARNGVLHSGFPHECKKHWLADKYWQPGPEGNDIQKTNVPNLRMRFRYETHQEEMRLMYLGTMEHARQGHADMRFD